MNGMNKTTRQSPRGGGRGGLHAGHVLRVAIHISDRIFLMQEFIIWRTFCNAKVSLRSDKGAVGVDGYWGANQTGVCVHMGNCVN